MDNTKKYQSSLKLSVRRKPNMKGLPGDDTTEHRYKIGSSIRHKAPLSGLDPEEEKIYLPSIIGTNDKDNMWNAKVQEYWNNISENVPADGTTTDPFPGRVIEFTIEFNSKEDADAFKSAVSFEEKAKIAKKGLCISGISDYILFRYCLEYGRVANTAKDVNKSPKIRFYLYSKTTETVLAHQKMTLKLSANDAFSKVIMEPALVNALLRMFKQLPEVFETDDDRHMALFSFVESDPSNFLKYYNDKNIKVKATILKAVEKQIINNPANTDSYYYGDNQEIFLGSTLDDAVIWFKHATEGTNLEVKETIKSRLKA